MADNWQLPIVEYIPESATEDGLAAFEMRPGDPSYDDYVSCVSEGWCPSDAQPGPSRLRPFSDVRTREQWAVCEHNFRWRLSSWRG
jgi:hypothetical protein